MRFSFLVLLALPLLSAACTTSVVEAESDPSESAEAAVSAKTCLFGSTRQSLEASTALQAGPSRTIQLGAQP